MSSWHSHRWLLVLVALLFAAGHAHDVLGRFVNHHHADGLLEVMEHLHDQGDGGDHHDHGDGDGEKDARHMQEHDAVTGLAAAPVIAAVTTLDAVAMEPLRRAVLPEPPVRGIEYPPQLRG